MCGWYSHHGPTAVQSLTELGETATHLNMSSHMENITDFGEHLRPSGCEGSHWQILAYPSSLVDPSAHSASLPQARHSKPMPAHTKREGLLLSMSPTQSSKMRLLCWHDASADTSHSSKPPSTSCCAAQAVQFGEDNATAAALVAIMASSGARSTSAQRPSVQSLQRPSCKTSEHQ